MKRTKEESHELVLFINALDEMGLILEDNFTIGKLYEMEIESRGYIKGVFDSLPKKEGDVNHVR